MWTLWMGYLFGLAQGVRHAFEPDHIAAVSTVVAERRSARASALYAAWWGIGHALVLLVAGGSLFVLRQAMPERLARLFELGVAVMLVVLGLRALRLAVGTARGAEPLAPGDGDTRTPREGVADDVSTQPWTLARRPLFIGVVHGLAGSGALTAIVASTYPSAVAGLLFMLVYGLGAAGGMALLAGVAGVPLAHAMRTRFGPRILLVVTGVFSLVLGFAWGQPIVQAMILR